MGVSQKILGYHNKKQQRVLRNSIRKPVEDPEKRPWRCRDGGIWVGERRKKEESQKGGIGQIAYLFGGHRLLLPVIIGPWPAVEGAGLMKGRVTGLTLASLPALALSEA